MRVLNARTGIAAILVALVVSLALPAAALADPASDYPNPQPGFAASDYPNPANPAYSSPPNPFSGGLHGECTWYVWGRTLEKLGIPLGSEFRGDAGSWYAESTYPKDPNIPKPNSIAVWTGHVAFVEEVNGDNVTFTDANYLINAGPATDHKIHGPTTLTTAQMRAKGSGAFEGYVYVGGSGPPPPPPPAGPRVLAGDFDGNGYADLVRFVDYGSSSTGLWSYLSNGTRFDVAKTWSSGPNNWTWSNTRPVAADIDGDGKAEICAFYNYGNDDTGLLMFRWNGSAFTTSHPWDSGAGNWSWAGTKPFAADIDGDGKQEVCCFYDYGNNDTALFVFKWNGSGFTVTRAWDSGANNFSWAASKPVAADIDGDGKAEICNFYDYGNNDTAILMFRWNGSGFTTTHPWDSHANNWSWAASEPLSGDFDHNGIDEIPVFYDYGSGLDALQFFRPSAQTFAASKLWQKTSGDWDAAHCPASTAAFATAATRLPSGVTIKATAATTSVGKTQTLSGAVTPIGMVGNNIVVYVMKPGKTSWTYSSNRGTYALSGKAAWQYKYYFKSGMPRGVYKFKAVVPDSPGFRTSISPTTVSVRLK